mgnify:FL=1
MKEIEKKDAPDVGGGYVPAGGCVPEFGGLDYPPYPGSPIPIQPWEIDRGLIGPFTGTTNAA